jgi:hypothetical protein
MSTLGNLMTPTQVESSTTPKGRGSLIRVNMKRNELQFYTLHYPRSLLKIVRSAAVMTPAFGTNTRFLLPLLLYLQRCSIRLGLLAHHQVVISTATDATSASTLLFTAWLCALPHRSCRVSLSLQGLSSCHAPQLRTTCLASPPSVIPLLSSLAIN